VGASFLPPPLRASSRDSAANKLLTARPMPRRRPRKEKPLGPRPWRASRWDPKGVHRGNSIGGSISAEIGRIRLFAPRRRDRAGRRKIATAAAEELANQVRARETTASLPRCERTWARFFVDMTLTEVSSRRLSCFGRRAKEKMGVQSELCAWLVSNRQRSTLNPGFLSGPHSRRKPGLSVPHGEISTTKRL